ncbi:MAG: hypothetical protein ABIL58_04925 [Pseudomonadota bacterium]
MMHRLIQKIAARPSVREAIADGADLSAFKARPSLRILLGVFLIAFSYVIGWPLVGGLGTLAVVLKQPLIAVIGGPLAYGLSHLVFLLGMFLAGAKYSRIFLRWATRVAVEGLITRFPPPAAPPQNVAADAPSPPPPPQS